MVLPAAYSDLYLDPKRNDIRIAVLQPGEWTSEVEVTLQVVSMDDQPRYRALSYVWGDKLRTTSILLGGQAWLVRLNLWKALRQLRSESKDPQNLWIDALCINQEDDEERSYQVTLMGNIYKSSQESVLWFGEVEDEPIAPFQAFERPDPHELMILRELVHRRDLKPAAPLRTVGPLAYTIDVPGAFEIVELLVTGKHLYELPFWYFSPSGDIQLCQRWVKSMYSLENILRRHWWRRIWTVQEAYLPSQARIHIGPYNILFRRFLEAVKSWQSHRGYRGFVSSLDKYCTALSGLFRGYLGEDLMPELLSILEVARLFDASKARDRTAVAKQLYLLSIQRSATLSHDHVYGLLGLIKEFLHYDKKPDYSLAPAELYAATTKIIMDYAGCICLLAYSRPHYRHTIQLHLPSWTLDWNAEPWEDYFDICAHGCFTADRSIPYVPSDHSSLILEIEVQAVERVTTVGAIIQNMRRPPRQYVPVIESWLSMMREKGLEAQILWEVIHVATHREVGLHEAQHQAEWWEQLKDLALKDVSYEEAGAAAKGTRSFGPFDSMQWLDKRAVFVTEPTSNADLGFGTPAEETAYRLALPQGSVGMSLPSVRSDDLVVIAKGARSPLILRQNLDELQRARALQEGIAPDELKKCFTFVSVCYVHGLMQGQAVNESQEWAKLYLL